MMRLKGFVLFIIRLSFRARFGMAWYVVVGMNQIIGIEFADYLPRLASCRPKRKYSHRRDGLISAIHGSQCVVNRSSARRGYAVQQGGKDDDRSRIIRTVRDQHQKPRFGRSYCFLGAHHCFSADLAITRFAEISGLSSMSLLSKS